MTYQHWETASINRLLDHAKLENPYTKKPLSETMIFGIGGGLDARYKINDDALNQAGGLYIMGRPHLFSGTPIYSKLILKRLGLLPKIDSFKDHDKANSKLKRALSQGEFVQAFVHKADLIYHFIPKTRRTYQWPHSVVVSGWDEAHEEFSILDTSPTKIRLRQESFMQAWESFPGHHYTMLRIMHQDKLTKAQLKQAVHQGIEQHLKNAWSSSRNRWYLAGLEHWSNLILNDHRRHGWLRNYPDGKLYWAVRDAFESIETLGTGSRFYRLLYADFLDEYATTMSNSPQLLKAEKHYQHIGNGWRELAEMLLPDQVKLLKDTKNLLREIQRNIQLNQTSSPQLAKKMEVIDARIQRNGFPWGMKRTRQWLGEIRDQLNILIQMEYEALSALAKAFR